MPFHLFDSPQIKYRVVEGMCKHTSSHRFGGRFKRQIGILKRQLDVYQNWEERFLANNSIFANLQIYSCSDTS